MNLQPSFSAFSLFSILPSCYLLVSNNMGQHQAVNSDSSACRELGEGPGVSYPGLSGGLSHSRCHSNHRQVVTELTSVSVNVCHYFFLRRQACQVAACLHGASYASGAKFIRNETVLSDAFLQLRRQKKLGGN